MTPADKILTQIKEDREIRAKVLFRGKLRVDREGDLIGEAISGVPDSVAVIASCSDKAPFMEENGEFFAHAANTWERKNRQLEIAVKIMTEIQKAIFHQRQMVFTETKAMDVVAWMEEHRLALKKALGEMEAVK